MVELVRAINMPAPKYDQVLVDVIRYVYHAQIESPRAFRRARIALLLVLYRTIPCPIAHLRPSASIPVLTSAC
jgi:hypothetical protein